MIGLGFLFFFLVLWTLWAWQKGRLKAGSVSGQRPLLASWMAALPLSYVAVEAGWMTREVGRQPWVIYGVLRTSEAVSPLPGYPVGASLLVFAGIYGVMFVVFLLFAWYIIHKGPEAE
jgi:cytochrome d ubiquinol oxidase subunit I